MPQSQVGLIFAVSAAGVLGVGPAMPKIMDRLGGAPRTMLKAAALTAATQLGMASMALVHSPRALLALSSCLLLVKACAAVGSEVGAAAE